MSADTRTNEELHVRALRRLKAVFQGMPGGIEGIGG
jgi:hypothetical protein